MSGRGIVISGKQTIDHSWGRLKLDAGVCVGGGNGIGTPRKNRILRRTMCLLCPQMAHPTFCYIFIVWRLRMPSQHPSGLKDPCHLIANCVLAHPMPHVDASFNTLFTWTFMGAILHLS